MVGVEREQNEYGWWVFSEAVNFGNRYGVTGKGYTPEPLAFVSGAKQELLRLIVDVQQNRNRPEGME